MWQERLSSQCWMEVGGKEDSPTGVHGPAALLKTASSRFSEILCVRKAKEREIKEDMGYRLTLGLQTSDLTYVHRSM